MRSIQSNLCPCCRQQLPVNTDLQLYPKSAAIIRHGYVLMPGMQGYRVIETLWRAYPDWISSERLYNALYSGTRDPRGTNNVSVQVSRLRRMLKIVKLKIETRYGDGYHLVIE